MIEPTPPSRAALAAVLAQAADSEPLLLDRPIRAAGCVCRVDLANGWSLRINWTCGLRMGPLVGALSPDGGVWTWGCDRWPDWNAAAEAVVLDPLQHLLSAEQREQLRQRLLTCACHLEPEPIPPPQPLTREELDALFPVEEMAS